MHVSNPVYPRRPFRPQHFLPVPNKQKTSHYRESCTEGRSGRVTTVEVEMQTREMDQAEVGSWQCQNVTGSSTLAFGEFFSD